MHDAAAIRLMLQIDQRARDRGDASPAPGRISSNRKLFPWRTVIWGMILQFAFAIFILKTPIGLRLFQGAQVVMDQLNVYANEGAKMVFGPLGDAETLRKHIWRRRSAYVFAVSVTATIILISALSSLLYHWGVLQKVVAGDGVGDDENDAHERQRKSGRREPTFSSAKPKPRSSSNRTSEDDAERNRGADDDRLFHHRDRRDGGLRRHGRNRAPDTF